jgi:hypothetical protein
MAGIFEESEFVIMGSRIERFTWGVSPRGRRCAAFLGRGVGRFAAIMFPNRHALTSWEAEHEGQRADTAHANEFVCSGAECRFFT